MKITKIWLSLNKKRRHPRLIFQLENGAQKYITLKTLNIDSPADVQTAKTIYEQKRREIAFGLLTTENELINYQSTTLSEFARIYARHRNDQIKLGDRSRATLDEDHKAFLLLKTYAKKDVLLQNINEQFAADFVRYLRHRITQRKKPMSNQTINKTLRTLQAAFNYAMQSGYILQNPFALIPKLKTKRPQEYIRVLTIDEQSAFEDYFLKKNALWSLHAFRFALNTLCRASSIINVRFVFCLIAYFCRFICQNCKLFFA